MFSHLNPVTRWKNVHQKVLVKFFLQSETQTKIFGCQKKNSGRQFFYRESEQREAFGTTMASFPLRNNGYSVNATGLPGNYSQTMSSGIEPGLESS